MNGEYNRVNYNAGWWCNNHLEKYWSMGRIIPYIMENQNAWNHQPEWVYWIYKPTWVNIPYKLVNGFINQHSHHWKTKNLVPFPALHDDSWPAPQRPRIAYRNGESCWINGTVFVFSLGKAISADSPTKNNCWLVVFRHPSEKWWS